MGGRVGLSCQIADRRGEERNAAQSESGDIRSGE
jgi:hypothetical protein